MATVRLFARLRELAGTSRIRVDGSTVGEVLDILGEEFGSGFIAVLDTARVWRNGDSAARDEPVGDDDEIALLPPVSGGAATIDVSPQLVVAVPILAAAVAVLANLKAGDAWWAAVVVGIVGAWVVDVAFYLEDRGRPFPALAVLVGVVAGATLPYAAGAVGMALATALSVVVVLMWGTSVQGFRRVDAVAPGAMVAILGAAAASSMVLARSNLAPDPQAIDVFLLVVGVSVVLGVAVDRMSDLPFLDPFTVMAVSAILVSILVAFLWNLDVAGYLPVGLEIAMALVAGRGLGSLLRLGGVSLTARVPGVMRSFDGAVLAAALFFPVIRLVL